MNSRCGVFGRFLLMAIVLVATPAVFAGTIYVDADATGSNNGSSWSNAYTCLQDAISAAQSGDQVWVAQGTYTPDKGSGFTAGDYTAAFALPAGVEFYGGFTGTETAIDQRDWAANETILSGDLNGNDGEDFANYGENSYHILLSNGADLSTILDGFVVKGANANDAWPNNVGSALLICSGSQDIDSEGSMSIANCTFTANKSANGGSGAWLASTATTFTNCTFSNNSSDYFAGALYLYSNCTGAIIGCNFIDNSASNSAGAIRVRSCNPNIENCSFTDNYSGNSGGGIMVTESANPTIIGCDFTSNVGTGRGGGLYVGESSSAIIEDCYFEGNKGPYGGGARFTNAASIKVTGCTFFANGGPDADVKTLAGAAIYNYSGSQLEIDGCYFLNNDANDMAAGLCLGGSSGTSAITNCVFAGNVSEKGSALRAYTNSTVANCTFYGNTSTQGDTIANGSANGLKSIVNSILWDGANTVIDPYDVLAINYCDIQGGWTGTGDGNIDADPLFIDADGADGIVGTVDDDCHLAETSPCVDAGDNNSIPLGLTKDMDGHSRIANLIVDLGAYEIAGCGDENHPIPDGDINLDCRVNIEDLSIIAENWLVCTAPECD